MTEENMQGTSGGTSGTRAGKLELSDIPTGQAEERQRPDLDAQVVERGKPYRLANPTPRLPCRLLA